MGHIGLEGSEAPGIARGYLLAACLIAAALLPAAAQGQANAARHHWWHDPVLAQPLALTAQQQKQLDAAFAKSLETRRGGAPNKARMQFDEALAAGDEAAARRALEAWTAAEQAQVRATAELKLEAMRVLEPEQWKKLREQRPELLRQPWAPRASWAAPGKPGARPAPGAGAAGAPGGSPAGAPKGGPAAPPGGGPKGAPR